MCVFASGIFRSRHLARFVDVSAEVETTLKKIYDNKFASDQCVINQILSVVSPNHILSHTYNPTKKRTTKEVQSQM